jgi:sigma-B regulation protein RsbU (phosphoserine phosphatase)
MEVGIVDRVQSALLARRDRLRAWLNDPRPAMGDGMRAGAELPALAEVETALGQIEDGSFGICHVCHELVSEERLELDFTACVCLEHYSEEDRRDLERDLELAARVQQHFYPVDAPTMRSVEIAGHAQPARIVSGDYFDYFRVRGGMQGLAIGDVMGKGLPASLLMANLQASLRILGPEHDALDELALRINGLFQHNLRLIRFISLALVAIDEERGQLRYVNAGHNPPLLWSRSERTIRRLAPTGPAIGMMPDPPFSAVSAPFSDGDVLLLYTDGLVEARDANGEPFGDARLEAYLAHHHAEPAERLLAGLRAAVTRFAPGPQRDDMSMMVVRRAG